MKLNNRQKTSIASIFSITLCASFAWALFFPAVDSFGTMEEARIAGSSKWLHGASYNVSENTYRVNNFEPTLLVAILWAATSAAIAVFEDKS